MIFALEQQEVDNNFSLSVNETQHWYRHALLPSLVLSCAYGLVFIVGFVGNVLVIIAVARGGQMMRHSATNIFLTNLAVADLLVIIVCVPSMLIVHLIYPWIFGSTFCKLLPYFQGVSVCASAYSLVAVAVERCRSVRLPLNQRLSTRSCRVTIAIIWIAAALITSPWMSVFQLQHSHSNNISSTDGEYFMDCTEVWSDPRMDVAYFSVARLTLCYIAPLLVIVVCYALVCHRIWKHQIPGSQLSDEVEVQRQTRQFQRTKLRALRMVGFVVAAFAFAWLPSYATFMRLKLAHAFAGYWGLSTDDQIDLWKAAVPIAQWMSSANSCVNPFLYHFLDPRFRFRFRQMLLGREPQQMLRRSSAVVQRRRRAPFQSRMIAMPAIRRESRLSEPVYLLGPNMQTEEIKNEWV